MCSFRLGCQARIVRKCRGAALKAARSLEVRLDRNWGRIILTGCDDAIRSDTNIELEHQLAWASAILDAGRARPDFSKRCGSPVSARRSKCLEQDGESPGLIEMHRKRLAVALRLEPQPCRARIFESQCLALVARHGYIPLKSLLSTATAIGRQAVLKRSVRRSGNRFDRGRNAFSPA